jgi:hypothetical protein
MTRFDIRRSTAGAVVLLALILAVGAGCGQSESEPAATPTPEPVATESPSPNPSPSPTTVSRVWNITRNLSGLEMTMTLANWTGDDLLVEWVITNRSGQKFDRDYLNNIFSIGAIATDQDGNEGEYFVPPPFTRDLAIGQMVTMETKWILRPESRQITLRFWDIREPMTGSSVDDSVVFVFSR